MYDFDTILNKRGTTSGKWCEIKDGGQIPNGAIPMHVAETDYLMAPPLMEKLQKRAQWSHFGYDLLPWGFDEAVIYHYKEKYNAVIEKEWIVKIPSVMVGLNTACRMAKGTIFYNSPMYSHIRRLTTETQQPVIEVPMDCDGVRYTMSVDRMEEMLTDDVSTFILCNPHNPVGRIFTQQELEEAVGFCKKHNLLLLSDEIHCEVAFDGKHIPCFSVNQDAADISITFNSAGKILNIPGIPAAIAIIPNKELREKYLAYTSGMFPWTNAFAWEALLANYDNSCDDWKKELLAYLKGNRDYLEERVAKMPKVKVFHGEATFLSWLDCREMGTNAFHYFLKEENIAFGDGAAFGREGYMRINYACTRKQLERVLDKMENALKRLG